MKLKKIVWASSIAAVTGTSIHYGVIVPSKKGQKALLMQGSNPILDKNKGNPNELISRNQYYTQDFDSMLRMPSVYPSLKVSDLPKSEDDTKKFENIGFSKEILNALNKSRPVNVENFKVDQNNSKVYRKIKLLRKYMESQLSTYAAFSDREITYKDNLYMGLLNEMDKNDFIKDMIWSLAEESNIKNMVVRPGSIKIDFDLENDGISSEEKLFDDTIYPTTARKINNFNFSFKVFNPTDKNLNVLNSIPIDPYSESEVTIMLNNSEVRPFPVPVSFSGTRWKASNWSLIPTNASKFNISVTNTFPNKAKRFILQDNLNLLYGKSKFFDQLISGSSGWYFSASNSISSPIFQDFKKAAEPLLMKITKEQIKKDVETWYGAMLTQHFKLRIIDIQKMLQMFRAKILTDSSGKPVSFLHKFLKDNNFRNGFYNLLYFENNARSVVNGLFDDSLGDEQIKLKELNALLVSLQKNFKDIQSSIKVTFKWLQEPTLGNSIEWDDEIYPAVSMKFEQTIEFEKDFEVKFKSEESVDGENVSFDFSKKLHKLKEILSPISSILPSKVIGLNVLNSLIPDGSQYLGWESWKIKKGEKTRTIYESNNSPIRPSVSRPMDHNDQNNRLVSFGWKLLDVSVTYDFSNFYEFFYQFYKKMDEEKKHGFMSLGQMSNIPISVFLGMINNWAFSSAELAKETPLKTIFKSLLNTELKVDSDQMFVGQSRAYFDIDEKFLEENKEEKNGEIIFKSQDKSQYEVSKEDYFFPAKPKTKELENIVKSFHFYYSTFFPNSPIIFGNENKNEKEEQKYIDFLNNEGKTSEGLIKNKNKLKEILKSYYLNYLRDRLSFPEEKSIDWSKVKVSLVRLKVAEAIKSLGAKEISSPASWALFFKGITLDKLINDILIRDVFYVYVNLMMEDGSLSFYSFPIRMATANPRSVYEFGINLMINHDKLKEIK